MKAIHLICRRDGVSLKGLSRIEGKPAFYQSCCWALREADHPQSLVGGWVYLHPVSKSAPSEFGGKVHEVVAAHREGKSIEEGYILVIEAKPEGKNQKWRGAEHVMAWTGGVIDASLPHEIGSSS